MAQQIELNPVSYLTVGTVGPLGQRTFYLQGRRGIDTISLIVEKEQASIMADSLETFLEELDEKHPEETRDAEESVLQDMRLREPVEGLYRVGNMGLGYNESGGQIVLVAYELVDEDEGGLFEDGSGREPDEAYNKREDDHPAGADLVLNALGRGQGDDLSHNGYRNSGAHE